MLTRLERALPWMLVSGLWAYAIAFRWLPGWLALLISAGFLAAYVLGFIYAIYLRMRRRP